MIPTPRNRQLLALTMLVLAVPTAHCLAADAPEPDDEGFYSLFDGKSLDGWKVGDNAGSFKVEDGVIVVKGPVGHLFYEGPVEDHDFKNFVLKLQVMTKPGANSGVYVHTEFQEEGWPAKGYECQVNNSQGDWRRTGSLYAIKDVRETKAKDNEWFDYTITVEGKKITLDVNGETTVEFEEPAGHKPPQGMEGRFFSSGTVALQAHDPGSEVHYRNIRIKPLP